MNKLIFPAVFATNTLAMTVLLIAFGLAGDSAMAADIGMVQGASLALFYAMSANARSLILNPTSPICAHTVMLSRLVLLAPIAATTFFLSTSLANVSPLLASILILRRSIEWLGEVHLSELERTDEHYSAKNYLASQLVLLAIALAWGVGRMPFPLFGIFLWALLPAMASIRFILESISKSRMGFSMPWRKMLPHFGSTAIIGITVYVFRLLLLLIVGKSLAGDLFTAFAMGGVIGSVFANALGPSLVLAEHRSERQQRLPAILRMVTFPCVIVGIALIVASSAGTSPSDWVGKSSYFWNAVGYSLLGGVFMVHAQLIRLRILQNHNDSDLFGPDTLMNVIIIMSVPLLTDLFGVKILTTLYLMNAALALIFYWSYQKGGQMQDKWAIGTHRKLGMLIAVLILLPIFFQLGSGLFLTTEMNYNSQGMLRMLPLPASVVICYAGIVLLGAYRQATISLGFIFFVCLFMIGASILGSQGFAAQERAKLTLLIQFVIPMLGLVLGQQFASNSKFAPLTLEVAFLYTLMAVVPLQLLASWIQGHEILSPYLYLFSIYQHLQYVPVIFVSAYLLTMFSLWHEQTYRKPLIVLTLLMGVYCAASISMLAMLMLLMGLSILSIYRFRMGDKLPAVLLLGCVLLLGGYLQLERKAASFKFTFLASKTTVAPIAAPSAASSVVVTTEPPAEKLPNFSERLRYWKYYSEGIVSNSTVLFLGHVEPPDRKLYPSAHNYYLDLTYNFGLLGLFPLLVLIGYLLDRIYRCREIIYRSPQVAGLVFVVLFLVLIDNSLKVGLRQPYSGIFTFFLIGILLSKLSRTGMSACGRNQVSNLPSA